MRALTQAELNRALLARQLLLERRRLPLPRALERVAGIQAQYAPSMYVGLWSRLEGFERAALDAARERRSVVVSTLMRATIHLVSRADYWPFAVATRDARRKQWQRTYRDVDMSAAGPRLREALAGGSMRGPEVEALVGKDVGRGVNVWLDLVRVPPSGTWARRRADIYAAGEDWIGPPEVEFPAAAAHLVRRYLAGFGPATVQDIMSFTGLPATAVRAVLEGLELRRFAGDLVDLPRAPLPPGDTPAPPRFLPTWDATLLVHARRTGILPEEYRPRIFSTRTPHSYPTFLVDGRVAGTWKHVDGRIELEPFAPLAAADREALEAEGEHLAAFMR